MKLSSLDIRKHEFRRGFRGYEAEEVDNFLQMLAQQWQEIVDESRRLQDRLDEQATRLNHYMKVEEALEQALETARDTARIRIESADQYSASAKESANREADATLGEAKSRAHQLVSEAEDHARQIVAEAEDERRRAHYDVVHLGMRRSEITARLRAFLTTEQEVLARFESMEAAQDADFETSMPTVSPSSPRKQQAAAGAAASEGKRSRKEAASALEATAEAAPALGKTAEAIAPLSATAATSGKAPEESTANALADAAEGSEADDGSDDLPAAHELDSESESSGSASADSGGESEEYDVRADALEGARDKKTDPAKAESGAKPDPGSRKATKANTSASDSRGRKKKNGSRQGELMEEAKLDTTDEIKKIRRILEDLDS